MCPRTIRFRAAFPTDQAQLNRPKGLVPVFLNFREWPVPIVSLPEPEGPSISYGYIGRRNPADDRKYAVHYGTFAPNAVVVKVFLSVFVAFCFSIICSRYLSACLSAMMRKLVDIYRLNKIIISSLSYRFFAGIDACIGRS